MKSLIGKTALVTGASGGIGKYIAEELALRGAKVALHYNSSEKAAEAIRNQIRANGGEAEIFCCDIRSNSAVRDMIKEIEEAFGGIDILVNNAGVALDARIHKMPEEYFDNTMAINVKGTWNTMQHVLPMMMEKKEGAIINISSVSGIAGNIGQSAYSGSKAAVIGMTKTVAKEAAAYSIRVNAVAPGFIEVGMSSQISDKLREMLVQQIPMKRQGKGEEVAKTVAFLASDDAGYITGQVIEVNGGMNM
ncbi:3-oxoacyl-ACP reductase family protein [Gallibacter intestinalis]|uniref:3-oxoacyl-ACP reductase FabG n=1 Tax=Gallibacter intestinalis TaxID=2779356 RepID=A0ABR9QYX8_9FIRM|nr:3-oxoacyl-ACP reductase family protein [Gallibacter intestinalis]MBE5036096.1 3-oxoacyl-ACP reductase FabG [Gallibacter intestinalis]